MRRRTNRALLLSLGLHIGLMLAISPFLVNHFHVEKESISAEILEPESEKSVRRRVLRLRRPQMSRVANAEGSTSRPASPMYAPEVSLSKAPVHAEVVPDIVTHADLPKTNTPSPVSNAGFGEEGTAAGPVVIEGQQGSGVGGTVMGRRRIDLRIGRQWGSGVGGTGVSNFVQPGLGIFGTDIMPGHGLIGQVYVSRGKIYKMPDFDLLTPVYTFVTPNLDVRTRIYIHGFPTPEMQSVVENFAIRFRAKLKIDTPGTYIFGLFSDDGSQLYIDGTLVVDNDGVHSTIGRQGSIKLDTGVRDVDIRYFQGPRHQIALQWFYQPPNADRQIVPPEVIYHPGKSHIPDVLKKLQQRFDQIEEIE